MLISSKSNNPKAVTAFLKPLRQIFNQIVQICFFIALWLAFDRIAHIIHCSVPAGVLALFLVVGLLLVDVLPSRHIEAGARRLLSEMPLLFVPPLLAITDSGPLFSQYGLKLLAALVIGNVIVMSCTGMIVDRVFRFEARLRIKTAKE